MAILLIGGLFMFPACCQDDDDEAPDFCSEEGIIINLDYRLCACCGGWFIEIGNDTLRATVLPEEFREGLPPDSFPIPVYLEWTPAENLCLGDEIVVTCIRRR